MKLTISKDSFLDILYKMNSLGIKEKDNNSDKRELKQRDIILLKSVNEKQLSFIYKDNEKKIVINTNNVNLSDQGVLSFIPVEYIKNIASMVRNLKSQIINIEVKDNKISISSGNFSSIIPSKTSDIENFKDTYEDDEITPSNSFSISGEDLYETLNMVYYAVAEDESRRSLNGVFFDINNESEILTCVATDGRRLAIMEKKIEFSKNTSDKNSCRVIIPLKDINIIMKFINQVKEIKIDVYEKKIALNLDNNIFVKLGYIDEIYPNYVQIIPKEFKGTVVFKDVLDSENGFTSVFKRVSETWFSDSNKEHVLMLFSKNELKLKAEDGRGGVTTDEIRADYEGEEINILVNKKFILDAVNKIKEKEFKFEIKDSSSPIKITDNKGFTYVMMPVYNPY